MVVPGVCSTQRHYTPIQDEGRAKDVQGHFNRFYPYMAPPLFVVWLLLLGALLRSSFIYSRLPFFQVPLPFPILLFVFGLTLVIIPLVNSPQIQFLYAALAIFGGLVLYLLIVVLRKTPKCMGKYWPLTFPCASVSHCWLLSSFDIDCVRNKLYYTLLN